MSAVFDLFKSACVAVKPYISFDELAVGDYFIKSFAYVDTKFGKKIRLDIGECVVFLPNRFINAIGVENIDEKIAEMNQGQYVMLYRGKNKSQFNQVMLDIEKAENYTGSVLGRAF